MNNSQVIHTWAQQEKEGYHGSRNVHFEDNKLYSYATVIAQIQTDDNGELWAFLSNGSFTPTTAKHVNKSISATNHLHQIFTPAFSGKWSGYGRTVEEMLIPIKKELQDDFEKLPRLRNHLKYGLINYDSKRTTLYAAIDAFGSQITKDLPEITEELKEKARLWEVNKEERERKAEIERVKRQAKQRELDYDNFHRWLKGEISNFPESYRDYNNSQITIHNGEILTSLGASAPISDTIKAFEFYDSRKNEDGSFLSFQSNGHVIRLGNFNLGSIDEKGNAKAGCHVFMAEEIARFRAQWNL